MEAGLRKTRFESALEDDVPGFELPDRMNRLGWVVISPTRLQNLR
jgi:hypothetical protein